jgi:hypothetical protein
MNPYGNKYTKALSKSRIIFGETKHFCAGSARRNRLQAKKDKRRVERRLSKALCRQQG